MDISFILILALAAGAMFLMTSRTRSPPGSAQTSRPPLAPGQAVMTGSALCGPAVDVDDEADVITIESTPGNQSRWLRAAIAKLVEPPVEETEETTADDASEDAAEYGTAGADAGTTTKGDVDDLVVPDDLSGLTDDRSEKDRGRRDDGTDIK